MKKNEISKIIERTRALLTENEANLLYLLSKEYSKKGDIVEIGAYLGGSTVLLAKGIEESNKRSILYSIDPHNHQKNYSKIGKENVPVNQFSIFLSNLKTENVEKYVFPIKKTSNEANKGFNKKINMLWIDGNHNYEYVKLDILLWERYLNVGGIIALHDTRKADSKAKLSGIYPGENCPGVMKAFDEEIIRSGRFRLVGTVDSISYAIKLKNSGKKKGEIEKERRYLVRIAKFNDFIRRNKLFNRIDYNIGKFGNFLFRKSPKIYFFIKSLLNR